jgi:hypothetical protein
MSAVLFARRVGGALAPADAASAAALEAIPEGASVQLKLTQPRNLSHHRKYWALLQAVFPHQTVYPTLDAFAAAMKVATGLAEPIALPNGRVVYAGSSISFARMDQKAFEQFYERAVQIVLTRILPKVDSDALDHEVQTILAGGAS